MDTKRHHAIPDANVIIVAGGSPRPIIGNMDCDIVFQDNNESLAEFYNVVSNKRKYDLFVFIGEEHNFKTTESLKQLIDWFWHEDMIQIAGEYSDLSIVDNDNNEVSCKINPTFRESLYKDKTILNIPFLVRSTVIPKFNTNVKTLCLWDGMLQLIKTNLALHFPYQIFTVNGSLNNEFINADIKTIHDTHY